MSTGWIAFFIGFFGSVHCIGMCGPLAFAIPTLQSRWWLIVADKLVYNTGRIVSYTLIGLLFGLIGRQLWVSGLQQGVSLFSGMLIILAGIAKLYHMRITHSRLAAKAFEPVNKLLALALRHRAGHFIIGMVNGFLPCGFVYLALVGAINAGSPLAAGRFMFLFGMGTFPLMLAATVSAGFVSPLVRRRINSFMPYLMVCLGIWFILRGMNLNIPYISPARPSAGNLICH
ncbi:sulfite exporter TauE/SafE family protein [Mucilaginibacter sp. L3T2-6]|uniref:sulfite exporter TauE/SafE family protein n=1 Tax=Mucilaginibacter sp. L3T2-6 TaxID=3062491 RepID=UPI00267713E4|nr:sulfite exporter TauE/SafE family protein [Mucilaginibacter sp. L3T2-6]MDO3642212.1 sulfite exporter TauE/SafE family protein [Mucilaginibacter sp. L3T2-6]MDV6214707.1 sulfite exporter TauE/SafE family protein [Mucilaginibacter sp. L3T2-6]